MNAMFASLSWVGWRLKGGPLQILPDRRFPAGNAKPDTTVVGHFPVE
jgi:hypothetical protein